MATKKTAGVDPYVGLRTRAHWSPADAARVLADWSNSGEPMAAFARRHVLGLHRLQWWRERLRKQPAAAHQQQQCARLVPAVVRRAPLIALEAGAEDVAIRVVVDGVGIEVSSTHAVDSRWLAELVSELRRARS